MSFYPPVLTGKRRWGSCSRDRAWWTATDQQAVCDECSWLASEHDHDPQYETEQAKDEDWWIAYQSRRE